MKLISFEHAGRASFGVVQGEAIIDLVKALGGRYPSLRALLAAQALGEIAPAIAGRTPDLTLAEVQYAPVIPDPGKIWCCGLNYAEHVRETQREVTEQPTFFMRVADSQVGHGQAMMRPRESTQFDFEAEIAVIIGRPGRRIREEDAGAHVAGYACYNDGSVRDWQRHTSQWIPGKNFWRTGGFGPWMVTRDEVGDITTQTLTTRVNGVVKQQAGIDLLIFDIPALIAYISVFVPLEGGDVIVTGTPGGVGAARNPPEFMKPGDVAEIEITGVGTLRNVVKEG